MEFDYFYGQQADMFTFFRIPKVLFTNDRFWNVSTDAKLLYGILLDRMNLSAKNGWYDEDGRVYIIFTVEEIMESLGCANKKSGKLLDELEKKCGLIERKRQGLGKPNLIYVKNFVSAAVDNSVERHFKKCQNDISANVEKTFPEVLKAHGNNTDITNTDFSDIDYSDTYPFLPSEESGMDVDRNSDYSKYRNYFIRQIELEHLLRNNPYDKDLIQDMLELMVETVCSKRQYIRIAGDDKPAEIVRSRFMKLDSSHIEFVIKCFHDNTTKVRNIKQYLLASIYNAPVTINGYYDSLVRHDMA